MLIETLLHQNLYSGDSLRASLPFRGISQKVEVREARKRRCESKEQGERGQLATITDKF